MGTERRSIIGKALGRDGGNGRRGKVLRIGILQGGRILEERLIRAGESVTVGESMRNTFVLPPSSLPASYKLFIARGSEYILAFRREMHGKIYINNTVVPLGKLAGNVAARRGDAYWLSLGERNRGKVQINGVTILFQFVDAPPEPRTAPVDFRPFAVRQMDWVFWGFFAVSFVLNMVGYIYIQSLPVPDKVTIDQIPDRYATVWFTQDPEPDEPVAEITDDGDEPIQDEPDAVEDPKPDGDALTDAAPEDTGPQETSDERAQRIRESLAQTGLAGIGTTGDTDNPDAVADLMGDTDRFVTDLDAALDIANGVRVLTLDMTPQLRDGVADNARDVKSLTDTIGIGGGTAGHGEKDLIAVRPEVAWDPPIVGAGVDTTGITGVVKKKKGQIKACYERELTGDPEIEGKVEVVIVVAADGSVDSVWVVDNTTGNAELGDCITRRIRQWNFPATGAEYEISYPFNLFKG